MSEYFYGAFCTAHNRFFWKLSRIEVKASGNELRQMTNINPKVTVVFSFRAIATRLKEKVAHGCANHFLIGFCSLLRLAPFWLKSWNEIFFSPPRLQGQQIHYLGETPLLWICRLLDIC